MRSFETYLRSDDLKFNIEHAFGIPSDKTFQVAGTRGFEIYLELSRIFLRQNAFDLLVRFQNLTENLSEFLETKCV